VVIFFIPFVAFGQGQETAQTSRLTYYFSLYSQADGPTAVDVDAVADFANKLDQKRTSFRNEKDFLEYLFVKTHRQFLKTFAEQCSFRDLMEKKTYNCLSGTAIYALLLDHFHIPYRIMETNYHIFVLATTSEGTVLLEATDPLHGFVDKDNVVQARIDQYKQNTLRTSAPSKTYYKYETNLYNEVNLDQLLGLLHYNLSVVAFNAREFPLAVQHLGKALDLYASPRMEEFSRILMLSVVASDLDVSVKEKYLRSIQSLRKKQLALTASAQ
jgi:hypothetical protein